jgi:hypothetical protein
MRLLLCAALGGVTGCAGLPPIPVTPGDDPEFSEPQLVVPEGVDEDEPVSLALEPGDVITVRAIGHEMVEYENLMVDERGVVHLPLAGPVQCSLANPSAVLPPPCACPHNKNPSAVLPTRRSDQRVPSGRAKAGREPVNRRTRPRCSPPAVRLPPHGGAHPPAAPRRAVPQHVLAALDEYKARAPGMSPEDAARLKAGALGRMKRGAARKETRPRCPRPIRLRDFG